MYWGHPFVGTWGFGIGGILSLILTVAFWLFFIFLIVAVVKGFRGHKGEEDSDEALNILKRRYAKGEITKRQFEEMKKDID